MEVEQVVKVDKVPSNLQLDNKDLGQIREAKANDFRSQLLELEQGVKAPEMPVLEESNVEVDDGVRNEDLSVASDSSDDSSDNNDTIDHRSDLDNKPIPKKRLDQELQRRREVEAELQKERDTRIRYETELNLFNQASEKLKTHQQNSIPKIDPLDEEAHNYYSQRFAAIEEQLQQKVAHLDAAHSQSRFESIVNSQAAEFTKKQSDFDTAYKFLVDTEIKNAELMGFNGEQAAEIALKKLQPMAWQVYNNGGNVAEMAYKLAKNYGYQAKNTQKSGVNLKNIEKNMAKAGSILDDIEGVSATATNPESNYINPENFKQLSRESGRGVDPDKFHRVLKELQRG